MKKKRRSYTIHKSKISQAEKDLTASEALRRNLEDTPYRIDTISLLKDVEYICDSKSEDLLSTRDTFKYIQKPIVWISAKPKYERDYSLLEVYLENKLRGVVMYGLQGVDSKNKLIEFVKRFEIVTLLEDAVLTARVMAQKGDAVVLSPSCVAYDGYANYVDRGNAFIKIVTELEKK